MAVAASFMMLLNGKRYHDEPTETPEVDTVELWEIINLTGLTHPVHIHLTQFRVLQRRSFAGTTFTAGVPLNYTGPARLPDPNEQGWKDTVRVYPYEVVTLWVPFTVRLYRECRVFRVSCCGSMVVSGPGRRSTRASTCGTVICWSTRIRT
jgi:spore coat protein A